MMNAHLHGGKWSDEEELYAAVLIEAFKAGVLPPEDIEEGTSLRKYLAKKLMCSPKRVSKKYEGTNYNGKQVYFKNIGTTLTTKEELALRAKIQILEHNFLKTLSEHNTPGGLESPSMAQELTMAQGQMQTLSDGHRRLYTNSLHDAALTAASQQLPQSLSLGALRKQSFQGGAVGSACIAQQASLGLDSLRAGTGSILGSSSSFGLPIPAEGSRDLELARMAARLSAGNQLSIGSLSAGRLSSSAGALSLSGNPHQSLLSPVRPSTQGMMDTSIEAARLQQLEESLLLNQTKQGSNSLLGTNASSDLNGLRSDTASLLKNTWLGSSGLDSQLPNTALESILKERSSAGAPAQAALPASAVQLLGGSVQAQLLQQNRHALALNFPNPVSLTSSLGLARANSNANKDAKRARSDDILTDGEEYHSAKRWKAN